MANQLGRAFIVYAVVVLLTYVYTMWTYAVDPGRVDRLLVGLRSDGTGGGTAVIGTGPLMERSRVVAAGDWIAPPFDPAAFTGYQSMTWTVLPANVQTYSYTLIGSTMTLSWFIAGASVGGTPSNALQLRIPDGYKTVKRSTGTFVYLDDGSTPALGIVEVVGDSSILYLYKSDWGKSLWSHSEKRTSVAGEFTIQVAR